MRYFFTAVLLFTLCNFSQAQSNHELGARFEFDAKNESEAAFVFNDNYNHYLLTVVNTHGATADHQMIIRKFDQKNQLLDRFNYEFPKPDPSTLYNYVGFTESKNGKVAVFMETYSGKTKKSEIFKHEFDKATNKFTSTVIASNPILSSSKAGDVDLEKSENGKYTGIVYRMSREKGLPEKNLVMMVDAATLDVIWKKDVSFENEYTSQNFAVTNSGKLALVRDMKGSKKGITYVTLITADGQEDKNFESPVFLNELKAISIGTEEYLLSLNSNSKNFRSDFYNNLLLYDLKSGKVLQNTKIPGFSDVKDLEGVSIRNIFLQNNEIHIFSEAKVSLPLEQRAGLAAMSSFETKYKFGPSYLHILSFDGKLKSSKKLYLSKDCEANLFHSFGVLNIKGDYCINTGSHSGVYFMDPANNFDKNKSKAYFSLPYAGTTDQKYEYVNQLFSYLPDSNQLLLGTVINSNQMMLIYLNGLN